MSQTGRTAGGFGLGWPRLARRQVRSNGRISAAMTSSAQAPGTVCETGTEIGPGIRVFHDAKDTPPVFRQPAGDGVALETDAFDGSYISQVIELDPKIAAQMRAGRDLVVNLQTEAEPAIPTYLRAHFSNEEGREVLYDLIVVETGPRVVRLNLDGLRIPLDLVTSVWVDVIYSNPAGTTLRLSGQSLSVEEQN